MKFLRGAFPRPSQARCAVGLSAAIFFATHPQAPPTAPTLSHALHPSPRCKKGFPLLSLTQQSAK
ncbi:MAG: hypothetical protein LBQ31_00725 [Bacteroidales bacterium]|nr:hypothetical protein [Bacteroidales bacterium]